MRSVKFRGNFSPFGIQFNSQLYSGAKQNYEYQGHESQPDHGLRRIMMGARCLNPTIGRMDGIDNYASAAPGWSSYRFAFNNPVMYTDPDGNFETSQYNSSTPVEVHGGTFNNGFREVSFRAAGYSVDYYDYSARAEGEETSSETNKANAQNKNCCGEALGLLKTAEMTSELEGREFGDVLGEVHERHLTGEKILLKDIAIGLALGTGTSWLVSGFKYLRALRAANEGTKLLSQFSTSTIDDAVTYAMKHKVTHVFGKAGHNLEPLVRKLGSQEDTFRTVLNAANGKLPASGVFSNVSVNVEGYNVVVRGSVVNGVPKIGTMFIP